MARSKSPAFSVYPRDFIADCAGMPNEAFGAYMRLILHAWDPPLCADGTKPRVGYLPNDPLILAEKSECGDRWASLSERVMRMFRKSDDGLFLVSKRLVEEKRKQVERSKVQSDNGKQGGRPRKQKESDSKANRNPSVTQAITETEAKKSFASASAFAFAFAEENKDLLIGDEVLAVVYGWYPRKVGKAAGLKSIRRDVKSTADLLAYASAVDAYAEEVSGRETDLIAHFSTFANRWRDHVPDDERRDAPRPTLTPAQLAAEEEKFAAECRRRYEQETGRPFPLPIQTPTETPDA